VFFHARLLREFFSRMVLALAVHFQCVACLGFSLATIASRTSALIGFLSARALAPVLEQALAYR
jgi:hypothetical protein